MPTASTYPSVHIPNVDLWGFLFERTDRPFPDDKVIYLDPETDRSYTYRDVRSSTIQFGTGLKALWDWKKGDVLAIYSPNCIDFPAVIWGCHWAGGIVTPANPGYTVDELAFQLKDARATALVTQKPFLAVACEAAKRSGISEDRIILIGDERDETMRFKHFTAISNASGTSRYRRTKAKPKEDLAFLVYSSGTTGHPKGVMLTHENIIANILQLKVGESKNLSWDGGPDGLGDRTLSFLPFFHIYGLTCQIHLSFYLGTLLVVMTRFDLERFCSITQERKITFAYVVPPVVLLLGKHPIVDKYNLSSIRMMNSGAAPLTKELVDAVYQRLKLPIKQGYGLSEASPTTHTQPWEDWSRHIGSVGRLLPNMTCKYVDPDGKEVSPGTVGELWIKGPNIFRGYLNNAEATAESLTPNGYFKTGDIGYQDEEGNFYITDRVKELIKYKGFQVPPAELEGLLIAHPSVADVAVIGVYSAAEASELPRAYIVLAPGVKASNQEAKGISDWLAKKVTSHKRLRGGVRFVTEIPKSASGKILRRVLKVRAQEEEKLVSGKAKL